MNIVKIKCPWYRVKTKCPYKRTPTRIVIHNTANDASARNEIAYMHRNSREVSFHFAVDDKEIIQGIELDRNAWHAGDAHGKGNMEGIAIEICYSKSGGKRFEAAQEKAAELTAYLLDWYGWGIDKVTKHQDYSGKYCPHRTLTDYGWKYFLNIVEKYLKNYEAPAPVLKSNTEIAREVIAGKWGNGAERKKRLEDAGYNYRDVQNAVNTLFSKPHKTPAEKSDTEIAREVITGKWGNGLSRRNALKNAGYNPSVIQKLVNGMLK